MLILDITEICFHPHFPDLISQLLTQQEPVSRPTTQSVPAELLPTCPALTPGTLIKATDLISEGIFHKSLILLISHSRKEGSVGLILNAKVTESIGNIRIGGPVEVFNQFVLHTDAAQKDKIEVVEGLYFTSGMIKPAKGKQSVLFFGYSGWRSGQLEDEFERGTWTVEGTASAEEVFRL